MRPLPLGCSPSSPSGECHTQHLTPPRPCRGGAGGAAPRRHGQVFAEGLPGRVRHHRRRLPGGHRGAAQVLQRAALVCVYSAGSGEAHSVCGLGAGLAGHGGARARGGVGWIVAFTPASNGLTSALEKSWFCTTFCSFPPLSAAYDLLRTRMRSACRTRPYVQASLPALQHQQKRAYHPAAGHAGRHSKCSLPWNLSTSLPQLTQPGNISRANICKGDAAEGDGE